MNEYNWYIHWYIHRYIHCIHFTIRYIHRYIHCRYTFYNEVCMFELWFSVYPRNFIYEANMRLGDLGVHIPSIQRENWEWWEGVIREGGGGWIILYHAAGGTEINSNSMQNFIICTGNEWVQTTGKINKILFANESTINALRTLFYNR